MKPGRNDPCSCGSGKKYKNCCLGKAELRPVQPSSLECDQLIALSNAGQHTELENQARSLIGKYPNSGFAWKLLGESLYMQGKEALPALQKATELLPGDADAFNNLGIVLTDLRQFNEAVISCRRSLELKPNYARAHNNLGYALHELGQLNNAASSFRRALVFDPGYAKAHNNLGNALKDLGQLDAAAACYRRAVEIKPDYINARSNLLFLYGYHTLIDPDDLVQARNWERACVPEQDRQAARHRVFQRSPLAGRRLKIGYVSGDYHHHAVSYFIEQLFAHHDRARIELFAYSANGKRDAVTGRLLALAEHWIPIVGIPDAAIRNRIEADGIDVLIDLSGHTAHNRLGIFARRAAPVQAHYLGFMASTGLTEMDYWIGDDILTPAETDSHFSEQVWRLPRTWVCYDGKADAPISSAWRPASDGSVWLGSFNNLGKLTPATLALWARVLHALPEGKLLLKTSELSDIGNRQRILDALSGHGILPSRIELQDRSITPDWSAHMAYYNRLDVALDPVGGVGGGTTTCDALWMGVPVIALEGDRMASRMTASMLNAIGRPEWIVRSEVGYINKVVTLARDVEQRKALRPSQRNRMASSPLCDARGLAMNLENAYVEMFGRWLQRQNERLSLAS